MTEDKQGQSRKHKHLGRALIVVAVVVAAVIVPPMVSVSRYKSQITHLLSTALGRPVRLASVEVRLLPRPGFVLTDLTVEEDPRYGAEPTLHAATVKASIRLLSLWRGKLEIGSISVDEASLNVVRIRTGEWNVDALFRTAASHIKADGSSSGALKPFELPSFAATNSRVNFKNGVEKLPFSLVNTDFSIAGQSSGSWRYQLKGQPARTDVRLDLADTGTLRLDGTAQTASELRHMPLRIDLVWKEAQLGQLSRLLVGNDPGWRGALTGELHLEGSADKAQIKSRLRAVNVHRAEFAPDAPLDFDANCSLAYHFLTGAYENLACDSPVGRGRVHLSSEHPAGAPLNLKVELDKLPAQAVLDAVRTVRSSFAEGLDAAGAISGQMTYAGLADVPPAAADKTSTKAHQAGVSSPLAGSFTLDGLKISGKSLGAPVEIAKVVLSPAAAAAGQPPALLATVALPAGAPAPLTVTARIERKGYHLAVHGLASLARARELARAAGLPASQPLEAFTGDPATLDLASDGPWLPVATGVAAGSLSSAETEAQSDRLSGTVLLHNVSWKSDSLVNPLSVTAATLRIDKGVLRWEPVEFTYGPVKGSATLDLPQDCAKGQTCVPSFHLEFAELDAAALQSALLGAQKKGTMLSDLVARLHPAATHDWPRAEGTVHAASFVLGPVTLKNFAAELRVSADQTEIASFDGSLLGGAVHGKGTLQAAQYEREQPSYAIEASFQNLASATVGQLLGLRFNGGPINAAGKLEATGYRGAELAASAKGSLHFDWKHGAVAGTAAIPASLAHFDQWTADWEFTDGELASKQSQAKLGVANQTVKATVSLEDHPKMSFAAEAKK